MEKRKAPAWLKPAMEFGPLLAFFASYQWAGLLAATAVLMAVTALSLGLSWIFTRSLPPVAVMTALVVALFGGLTLWLKDESFIKMKPSILYALFAAALAAGLQWKMPLLKSLLGEAIEIDEKGWRRLTFRLVFFFLAMAAANEVVRRTVSTELWVLWKFPGTLVPTGLFMAAQTGLIRRHRLPEDA